MLFKRLHYITRFLNRTYIQTITTYILLKTTKQVKRVDRPEPAPEQSV